MPALIQKYFPIQLSSSSSYSSTILFIILIILAIQTSVSTNLSVQSSSAYVGQLAQYTYSISDHSSPTRIQFRFGTWSPLRQRPFQLNSYQCLFGGVTRLTCTLRSSQTIIDCALPSSLSSSFTIIITNIYNPSSTKPLDLSISLVGSSFQTIATTLQVTDLKQYQISQINFDNTIGSTSTGVSWSLIFDNYFDANTFLQITYDKTVFTIDFADITGCSLVHTTTNTVVLSQWIDDSKSSQLISPISITNPYAALSNYKISGVLFFQDGASTYLISNFYLEFNLDSVSFTTIQGTTQVQLGGSSQTISLTSLECPYDSINKNSANTSYTVIEFNKQFLTSSNCPQNVYNNTDQVKSCSYSTSTNIKSITQVTATITNQTQFSVFVSQYTYFSQTDSYELLCQGYYSINFIPQIISNPTFDLSLCNNQQTTGTVNPMTQLFIPVSGWAADDLIQLEGIQGLPDGNWIQESDGIFQYQFSQTDSTTLSFPYYNPTYITSSNSITGIKISRPSLNITYASSSIVIPLCDVTQYSNVNSLSISVSSLLTYSESVTYSFKIQTNFDDYVNGDYIQLQFMNFQDVIYLSKIDQQISAKVNNLAVNVSIINDNTLRIIFLTDGVIASSDSLIEIFGLVNPPYNKDNYQILARLFSNQFSSIKQQGRADFPDFIPSQLYQISQSASVSILQTNQQIILTLQNTARYQYFNAIVSSLEIELPFICSTTTTDIQWPASTQSISINIQGCDIPLLIDSNSTLSISQTISGISSTYTNYNLKLTCSDYCVSCSSTSECLLCVSEEDGLYNFIYNGLCYQSCPEKTYQIQNQFQCQNCFSTCQSCSGNNFTQCDSCTSNFQLSTVLIDESSIQICISTCGENKFYDTTLDTCENCQIDCKYCINKNICFVCKDGATQVSSGQCDFTICSEPCMSCEGTASNCTGCSSEWFLYQYQCYEECPQGTYTDNQNMICVQFQGALLYFPATICSIVLVIIVCVCNKMNSEDLTETGRQNINILTYCSAIFIFMQFFALLVMLILTPNQTSKTMGIVGIVLWILSNIGFCIYYNLRIKNDDSVNLILTKMSNLSKCIYYTVLVLSVCVNLRIYRILYCGVFKGVTPYHYIPAIKNKDKITKNEVVNENKDSNNPDYQNSSTEQSTKFQLKKPLTLYLTIISLIGSFLFLVAAVIQITDSYFINMLIWGLDLLLVVVVSIIITVIDIWAGLKKSYLMAQQKNIVNNQTLQNLQSDENTQQKILHKKRTQKKLNKVSPPRNIKKSPQKKFSSLKKSNRNKPAVKPKPRQLSPEEKAKKQQSQKMKQIKSRYSDLYNKKSRRYDQFSEQQQSQIPDVKVFDSIDFKEGEQNYQPQKIRKIQTEHQRMKSTHNLGKNIKDSNKEAHNQTSMHFKMNDIFLGFLQDGVQPQISGKSNDDKKTVKIMDTINRTKIQNTKMEEEQNKSSQLGGIDFDLNSQDNNQNQQKRQKKKNQITIEQNFSD